jgi:hypothetical protein
MDHSHIRRLVPVILGGIAALALLSPASASTFTIGFEDATGIPNDPGPSTNNASNTFADAYGGSDTVDGVTFDDNFVVFRSSYTNGVGGTDLYGATDGSFALTNTAGGADADTGPGEQGLNGLTFTTHGTLTSFDTAANDYGNGSFGADSLTITAFGKSGDLASVTQSLVNGAGDPITSLISVSTGSAFDPFAGLITGYRVDRDVSPQYAPFDAGGNYILDDLTFSTPPAAPEPSPVAALFIGSIAVIALMRRARPRAPRSETIRIRERRSSSPSTRTALARASRGTISTTS